MVIMWVWWVCDLILGGGHGAGGGDGGFGHYVLGVVGCDFLWIMVVGGGRCRWWWRWRWQ